MLSTLSFEASKHHVKRFRRYMWTQINRVDDHLAGLEANDRRKLGELTKELQIISQNADAHLGNGGIAITTATAIRKVHARLHEAMGSPARVFGRIRLDRQDAASNIQLAASMKRDSTSMNAIAALTMVFLPETFTATILSAGSVTGGSDNNGFDSISVWWLWAAITVPLTLAVVSCWWLYRKRNVQVPPESMAKEEEDGVPPKKKGVFRSISLLFSLWRRRQRASGKV
ncbi:hypothetical protein CDV55_106182 [Aspergillus turcosus]|nr:hypothetical protein CDV55_106182 [Aspergillus turcosus]